MTTGEYINTAVMECAHCSPAGSLVLEIPQDEKIRRDHSRENDFLAKDCYSELPIEMEAEPSVMRQLGLGAKWGFKVSTAMKGIASLGLRPLECLVKGVKDLLTVEINFLAKEGRPHYNRVGGALRRERLAKKNDKKAGEGSDHPQQIDSVKPPVAPMIAPSNVSSTAPISSASLNRVRSWLNAIPDSMLPIGGEETIEATIEDGAPGENVSVTEDGAVEENASVTADWGSVSDQELCGEDPENLRGKAEVPALPPNPQSLHGADDFDDVSSASDFDECDSDLENAPPPPYENQPHFDKSYDQGPAWEMEANPPNPTPQELLQQKLAEIKSLRFKIKKSNNLPALATLPCDAVIRDLPRLGGQATAVPKQKHHGGAAKTQTSGRPTFMQAQPLINQNDREMVSPLPQCRKRLFPKENNKGAPASKLSLKHRPLKTHPSRVGGGAGFQVRKNSADESEALTPMLVNTPLISGAGGQSTSEALLQVPAAPKTKRSQSRITGKKAGNRSPQKDEDVILVS